RSTVQSQAGSAGDGEVHCQNVPGAAGGVVGGCAEDVAHMTVGEGPGVDGGRLQRGPVIPETDAISGDHVDCSAVTNDLRSLVAAPCAPGWLRRLVRQLLGALSHW